jgi:hypothetical protein
MKNAYLLVPVISAILASSANVLASPGYLYACRAKDRSSALFDARFLALAISGNRVRAALGDGYAQPNKVENFLVADDKYNPRNPNNSRYARYPGAEALISESGTVNLFVDKTMLQGATAGTAKLEWRGEGFGSGFYYCTRRFQ